MLGIYISLSQNLLIDMNRNIQEKAITIILSCLFSLFNSTSNFKNTETSFPKNYVPYNQNPFTIWHSIHVLS